MKMYTMDARTRMKLNKTLDSKECGDIESNVSSTILRKLGRDFKEEMKNREKNIIFLLPSHSKPQDF